LRPEGGQCSGEDITEQAIKQGIYSTVDFEDLTVVNINRPPGWIQVLHYVAKKTKNRI
jgi:hypothetical protein